MAYKVDIALLEKPKIWRTVIIPTYYYFSDLHMVIQSAMGWKNDHLYEFHIDDQITIGEPDIEYDLGNTLKDSRKTKLSEFINESELYCKYIYDFGDYWEHWIKIREHNTSAESTKDPVCCDGNGNCPPENSHSTGEPVFQSPSSATKCFDTTSDTIYDSQEHLRFDKDSLIFWQFNTDRTTSTPCENENWVRRITNGNISVGELIDDFSYVMPI